ncbi:hypothetical protein [Chelativorans salis]|uniref:Uncharacterized protein n=1 Tax=Chelativorans salis TaxID=2978478 RepID=A0ABT2LJW1_9HYPH|nr:hypothetical protein [Chelativorans sp. EGI FJ00035]MCT7374850.1 hypothetical protein [Chelativorans sp. EGI FJ00035]
MSKLDQIEKSVASLSDEELKSFAEWFDELRWQRWDRQLEADVRAGKLDQLIEDARLGSAAG